MLDIIKNLDKRIWWIHECTKSIFQYQTGLEFDDDCRPERMIVYDYRKAPKDHKERYDFALNLLSKDDNVLDAACGVGYGSHALSSRCKSVLGLDINSKAIVFANNIFKAQNLHFEVADLLTLSPEKYQAFDKIVSFETVEHVPNAGMLLRIFRTLLKDNGKLIFSVPNQNKVPFSKETHPFHEKHFTVDELKNLLEANGFTNIKVYFQYEELDHKVVENYKNSEGENIIIEADTL